MDSEDVADGLAVIDSEGDMDSEAVADGLAVIDSECVLAVSGLVKSFTELQDFFTSHSEERCVS